MTQQKPNINGVPFVSNTNQKRRLFLNSGTGFFEVANSKGLIVHGSGVEERIARIVDDHTPPSPSMKMAEIKISNAPSKIHSDGKASYKISLRLLFPDKLSYNDFIFFCGNQFKYYDEKGAIFLCVLADTPEVKRVEAGRRYDVRIQLVGVRKETADQEYKSYYTDLNESTVYKLKFTSGYHVKNETAQIYFGGTGGVYSFKLETGTLNTGNPATLAYYLTDRLTQSDFSEYYEFVQELDTVVIKPKSPSYEGEIKFYPFGSGMSVTITESQGDHWAKESIENLGKLGIFTQVDRNGNLIYVFRPNAYATRAELAVVSNKLRKYVERMIRG